MAGVLIDTHVLLWVLDGTLPRRLATAARRVADAVAERGVRVSIGSFLDLRYLVDAGRLPESALQDAERAIVEQEAFSIVPLDLAGHRAMREVPREQVPDPFDRITNSPAPRSAPRSRFAQCPVRPCVSSTEHAGRRLARLLGPIWE